MQRTLATHLEKLEQRAKPADGVFFLVWGSDRAGADKAVAEARAAGKIGDDDIVIAEVWPTESRPSGPARLVESRNRQTAHTFEARQTVNRTWPVERWCHRTTAIHGWSEGKMAELIVQDLAETMENARFVPPVRTNLISNHPIGGCIKNSAPR